jgi:4-hydroxy-tetrahydrodipicolinate synthase
LRELIEYQIAGNVRVLVPCGTTGESPTLTRDEHLRIVALVVEEAGGRVPVLAGAGGYNTREVIELIHQLEDIGVDGILSVTPYYNKPPQEGLYQHYKAIAESTPLPIVLYSVQGRTGVNIEPATVARLAGIKNIVGVKEASGNVTQMAEIIRMVPDSFLVVSGDDAVTVPLMSIGGRGIISVASNEIPAEMSQMVEAAERGDFAEARKMHQRLLPLLLANFVESSPGPVKFAMSAMGLCEEVYRLPMVPIKDTSKEKVLGVLRELGLAVAAHA